MSDLISLEAIERRIFIIRGHKVMIDRDLAELYGVETKYMNRQVRFNKNRFPGEFMFRITAEERNELVQICHRFKTMRHSSSMPYVFTEHGVAMLSSVLNSERAARINILIIKTFIKLSEIITSHKELAYKLKELETRIGKHDEDIRAIFDAICRLMAPPPANFDISLK